MTTSVIRGEPAVKREEHRCADEITFVEVVSTIVAPPGSSQPDSAGEGGKGGLNVNAVLPPVPLHPLTFLERENRAIYRPRQPSSLPFPGPGVENHGYHGRIGKGVDGGSEQGGPCN